MSRLIATPFSMFLPLILVACAKYPNWEHVRIEQSKPTEQCQYKVQESCPGTALEGCYNWFKKRATKYDANMVVTTANRLADYYHCP